MTKKNDHLTEELKKIVPDLKLKEPLAKHTTFHLEGEADFFAQIANIEQLQKVLEIIEGKIPIFILGAGSNVLVTEKGWPGIVIRLTGEFNKLTITDREITVGAGMSLPLFLNKLAEAGLEGLEFLAGIPGTAGGAIAMNAGLKKEWIGQYVEALEIIDFSGQRKVLAQKDLNFAYRQSNLEGKIALSAKFRLKKNRKDVIIQNIQKYLAMRRETQPQGGGRMGSIFKNPPGDFAGRLIEAAGFKGCRLGGIKVSEKHANFLINEGAGKAKDFLNLVKKIRAAVKKKFGVNLDLEIKIL
ncbi:MAG: UDP-N-acetylmuramate dehydrogenase [Elusimicrobiota bacterium]